MSGANDVESELAKAHAMSDFMNDVLSALPSDVDGEPLSLNPFEFANAALELLEESDYVKALQTVLEKAPRVFLKAWKKLDDVSEHDRIIAQELHDRGGDESIPLFARLPEPYVARASPKRKAWFVLPETHRFNTLLMRPLQRAFSNAVPLLPALDAIVDLHVPVVEMGCGSGLWTRMLRDRGVDVIALDLYPPGVGGDESIFDQAHIPDIQCGGTTQMIETVSDLSERALLLCWPFDEDDCQRGWDFEAISLFTGDVLVYVGDWKGRTRSEREYGITSSADFQHKVETEWIRTKIVPVGLLPMVSDELTVWRRKSSAGVPALSCPLPVLKSFCDTCNVDNPPTNGCCNGAKLGNDKKATRNDHSFAFNFSLG